MPTDLSNTLIQPVACVRFRLSKDKLSGGESYVSQRDISALNLTDIFQDLEISKPQKNSRNAAATAAGESLRAGYNRRSRSPDYARGSAQRGPVQRGGVDRGVTSNSFRDEPRRRDDYRPGRSPSPRGYRGRDEYRGWDRSPDRYFGNRRSRSRSPYNRNGRFRSRSPRPRDVDDEADLPLLRRDPRDVPDVQIILVDEVDRWADATPDRLKLSANSS